HQTTQQYGAILPIELTTAEIRNRKAYQEYYACAMGEAAPKPKTSARKKKGDSASSTTPPTPTPTTTAESAPRLQKTHISQQSGSSTGEGTGSKPEVSDVPSDDSEEELLWNSSNEEEVGSHEEGKESDDDIDKGSDNDSDETVKSGADSEKESNDEEEKESRLSEEARIQEEEDAEELYRDVNINQGRGLQVTQNVKDTHVILTPVNPDGPQESFSMSSFVSIMLNPLSDVGVESIFTTTSSLIVSLEPPTPIMTPSTIATITTSGEAPILPPTIPSIILESLPTFNSAFRFKERLRLLETSFSEYRQNNQFADAVSVIPDIVHQYMDQQIKEAVREAVQIQTDVLSNSCINI
nr:hypothetical protein [Tanacetum cinerariifolium]